jgi:hypothetical protein
MPSTSKGKRESQVSICTQYLIQLLPFYFAGNKDWQLKYSLKNTAPHPLPPTHKSVGKYYTSKRYQQEAYLLICQKWLLEELLEQILKCTCVCQLILKNWKERWKTNSKYWIDRELFSWKSSLFIFPIWDYILQFWNRSHIKKFFGRWGLEKKKFK